jgi:hypothetical protein
MKTKFQTTGLIVILSIIILTVLSIQEVNACEIDFKITKGKKESYQAGDTIVVVVKVILTHRSCPIAMEKTKFNTKGLKVLKSTPWKQLSTMNWERKLMIVVTESASKDLNLTSIRECDKDGGFGTLKLKME